MGCSIVAAKRAEGGVVVPNWIPYLCLFCAALAATLLTTPLARRIAVALGAVDKPNPRRINKVPVPRMGGIAIFCGIVAAFVMQYVGSTCFGWPPVLVSSPQLEVEYWFIVAAFVVIFLTGLIDDARSLTPIQKLIGQVAAATIAVAGGLVIGDISNPFVPGGFIQLGWVAYPVTVVYLVAYTNIINLIDGLDGLAAGISAIASFTMFVLSVWAGRLDAAALSIAVAGSSLGFLRYNFHPASIFMGDSGALTLGFALGAVSLLVAAIGIANTMIMSVTERTREIGIMKSLGCTVRDIRIMFLGEAGAIGFLGGVIGCVISAIASVAINLVSVASADVRGVVTAVIGGGEATRVSVIPWWLYLFAIAFSTAIGLLSGFQPANRAVRIPALDAIRNAT